MNNRILILIGGILAGGAAVFLFSKPSGEPAPAAAGKPAVAVPQAGPAAPEKKQSAPAPSAAETKTVPATGAWAKLAEKFGMEKTQKAKKISSDVADLIDQGMELANIGAKGSGASSVAEAASREAMRNLATQLGLNEEQQQKAGELIQGAVNERMGAITELASAMRSDPGQMMEMFLAGDALSRQEITQAEYDQMTQPTRTMLENIGGFMMGRPGAGGSQILGDEALTGQLNALLTPEQQTKLGELTTQWTEQAQGRSNRRGGANLPFQNGQIPVMDLDKLDQTVGSVKKMAGAARTMMEAMQGLREANPGLPGTPGAGQ
ncbi:MAG: hypothetical protein KA004_03635 [Verrucomicrobiales bacterium]|nr:hypothetical protein [Verrucomicrobiales bacterium]